MEVKWSRDHLKPLKDIFLTMEAFIKIPKSLFKIGLTPKEFAIITQLIYIEDYRTFKGEVEDGWFIKSKRELGKDCHIKPERLNCILDRLVELGLIQVKSNSTSISQFKLAISDCTQNDYGQNVPTDCTQNGDSNCTQNGDSNCTQNGTLHKNIYNNNNTRLDNNSFKKEYNIINKNLNKEKENIIKEKERKEEYNLEYKINNIINNKINLNKEIDNITSSTDNKEIQPSVGEQNIQPSVVPLSSNFPKVDSSFNEGISLSKQVEDENCKLIKWLVKNYLIPNRDFDKEYFNTYDFVVRQHQDLKGGSYEECKSKIDFYLKKEKELQLSKVG